VPQCRGGIQSANSTSRNEYATENRVGRAGCRVTEIMFGCFAGVSIQMVRTIGPSSVFKKIGLSGLSWGPDYDQAKAQGALDSGQADAIGFGRLFLSNPDHPHRFAHHMPLTPDDMSTWYTQDARGYLDYPVAQTEPA
jgi:hypothetical protein